MEEEFIYFFIYFISVYPALIYFSGYDRDHITKVNYKTCDNAMATADGSVEVRFFRALLHLTEPCHERHEELMVQSHLTRWNRCYSVTRVCVCVCGVRGIAQLFKATNVTESEDESGGGGGRRGVKIHCVQV